MGQMSPAPYKMQSVISPASVYSEDTSSSSSSDSVYSDSSRSSHQTPRERSAPNTPASASCTSESIADNKTNEKMTEVPREANSFSNVSAVAAADLSETNEVRHSENKIPHRENVEESESKTSNDPSKVDKVNKSKSQLNGSEDPREVVQEPVRGELSGEGTEKSDTEGSLPFEVMADPEAADCDSMDTIEGKVQPTIEVSADNLDVEKEG